jgi:subfamily B ATP-binding cassette protein MsbA
MDKNLIKLLPYTKKYQSNIVWNVTYNILYALFSTISMLTLLPMLEVLFGKNKAIEKAPVYKGIGNIMSFG